MNNYSKEERIRDEEKKEAIRERLLEKGSIYYESGLIEVSDQEGNINELESGKT